MIDRNEMNEEEWEASISPRPSLQAPTDRCPDHYSDASIKALRHRYLDEQEDEDA